MLDSCFLYLSLVEVTVITSVLCLWHGCVLCYHNLQPPSVWNGMHTEQVDRQVHLLLEPYITTGYAFSVLHAPLHRGYQNGSQNVAIPESLKSLHSMQIRRCKLQASSSKTLQYLSLIVANICKTTFYQSAFAPCWWMRRRSSFLQQTEREKSARLLH